jgi:hypothetical protein
MIRLVAAVFFLQMILLTPFAANAAPTLAIGEYDISVGETATVDILLSDIDTDFDSFGFYIEYDPTVLTASDITAGDIFPSETADCFTSDIWIDDEDSENAALIFYYSPFTSSNYIFENEGVLASFDLTGITEGEQELLFTNLAFSLGSDAIDISVTDGIVNVSSGANAVPIPSAILLLGGGLFGMLGVRRKIK